MKSDIVHVSTNGDGIAEALKLAERVSAYSSLEKKDAIHLRLFAEEMMGMMTALTGEQEADFWIEAEGGNFHLHLLAITLMDSDKREKLLHYSTSGKNDVTGFMGKVRDVFEKAVIAIQTSNSDHYGTAVIESGGISNFSEWSLSQYRDAVQRKPDDDWDELEHSVVAKLADEVRIRINGANVEMIIDKKI